MADFEEQDAADRQGPQWTEYRSNSGVVLNCRSPQDLAFCHARARLMLGCYRKDEVHDPETYVTAIQLVLSDYPRVVVECVTDPRTGLPGQPDSKFGIPNAGQVKQACDAELARLHRLAQPMLKRQNRPYIPPPNFPGCRCNVFVHAEAPQYPALLAWSQTKDADPRDWKLDEECRPGIHVALSILQNVGRISRVAQTWKSPSDAEIRESLARIAAQPKAEEIEAE